MRWRKTKGLGQVVKRFCRKQDGAAAVEFAIIGLPFFGLLLIIFETAAVIFTDIALQNGVTETARLIRTGQVQTQGINQGQFKQLLCENVASIVDCSQIRLEVSKSPTLPIPGANIMTVADEAPQSFEAGGPSEWVLVQARYDWKLMVPAISMMGNAGEGKLRRLTAGALFRNEPYGG